MGDHNNTSRLFHTAMLRVLLIAAFVATAFGQLAPHVPDKASPWSWDNCGTKLDRLETDKVSVSGKFVAGNKLTVTASGMTNLHVPLDTGAWQVRVYETGMPKSVSTNVGDLMKALKFTDAKNTTFSMTIQFDMPKKQASGEFNANLVATDQAKSDYLCLDIKYKLAAKKPINLGASCESITSQDSCDKNSACTWCKAAAVPSKCYSKEDAKKLPPGVFACDSSLALMAPAPPAPKPTPLCFHEEDTEDHKCFEACNAEGKKFSTKGIENTGKCPGKYNTVDTTKTVLQCPDGVTNVRYCAATALNVTIATKGEAGAAMVTGPVSDGTCPGSSAWVHAKTQLTVAFTNTCDEVKAEINRRVKGTQSGSWRDPHNGGVYTVTSSDASTMSFDHQTGNKKYTDKIKFTFSDSETGCSIQACSESQVTSVLDMSTNFCNIHDLYCTDDACHTGAQLSYTETNVDASSGQHDKSSCVIGPAVEPLAEAAPATPLCFHQEDTEDHKCFEACNAEGTKFATKGITGTGKCPANYNTVDTTKTVLQCPDGITNVRYCAGTALNVTIATKGEAVLLW